MRTGSARPVVIDLFAGAGGLSVGLEQAGFDVLAAVEYDPIHALVHSFNFPDCVTLCRDVRALSGRDLTAAVNSKVKAMGSALIGNGIDVIAGGPSCQGFSGGGQRDPFDERNDLLTEFTRLVVEVRPRAFILENVPGLLEPRFADFRAAHWKKFRNAGYSLSGTERWVDATTFGVPQTRKRVVVVGILDGPAIEIEPPEGARLTTVGEAFDGLPLIEAYDELLNSDLVPMSRTDVARMGRVRSSYAKQLSGVNASGSFLERPRAWDEKILSNSLRTVHSAETIRRFESTGQGRVESVSRLYRLAIDQPSRTLRAGTGSERGAHTAPRPIHPEIPRVITVREAARLHGYPDWFRFAATNWHGHRQVGNSVPPPLARGVGTAVMKALGARPRKPTAPRALGDPSWLRTKPQDAATLLGALDSELPRRRWPH